MLLKPAGSPLPGIILLIPSALAMSQEPICDPCTDGPQMAQGLERLPSRSGSSSPSRVFDRIRELGGTLRDMTHDCGASTNTSYEQIDVSVRACSWGGRYPALLFEPAGTDTVVVLASNGARLEVLFEAAAPASLVRALSGLLREDFDAMFRELSSPADG